MNELLPDPDGIPLRLPGTAQCPVCGSVVDTFDDGSLTPHAVVVTCSIRGVTSPTAIGSRSIIVAQEQSACPGVADGAEAPVLMHLTGPDGPARRGIAPYG